MRYAIVIEKAEGNYSAYVPDLPGCVATGAYRCGHGIRNSRGHRISYRWHARGWSRYSRTAEPGRIRRRSCLSGSAKPIALKERFVLQAPNHSIERTSASQLRWPAAAAHVER